MTDRKQINFTIVPEDGGSEPRTYANFCAVNHTPFDFTLQENMRIYAESHQPPQAPPVPGTPVH